MRDFAIGQMAANLADLEPVEMTQRLGRGRDTAADRIIDAGCRGADDFADCIGLAHVLLLQKRLPERIDVDRRRWSPGQGCPEVRPGRGTRQCSTDRPIPEPGPQNGGPRTAGLVNPSIRLKLAPQPPAPTPPTEIPAATRA